MGGGWRAFEEDRVIGGKMLRLIARVTPRTPLAASDGPAVRVMPQRRAKISVVIPCYNYARFLPDAVESASMQRGVTVEVIIVDDRSTDESREVAQGLAQAHPHVRVLMNPENQGHVRSFNAGWEVSTGDYVVKLDADDLLTPDSLSRAAALFEAKPTVGMVYGHPRHFSAIQPPTGRMGEIRWTVWRGIDWLTERCRLGTSAITNPEMVMRSSILRELGPMDPAVPFAPDMEISLRLAAVSDIGYVSGADQALHREHSDSMSETDGSGRLVDLLARLDAFERAFEAVGDRIAEADELLAQAREALAEDALRVASAAQDRGIASAQNDGLIAFARRVTPGSQCSRQFQRVESAGSLNSVSVLPAILRRLRRRLRHESYHLRWMVRGV